MILLSGGFDPLHPGHLAMISDAIAYGDVVIALNSDDWLVRKKGFFFQTWDDRAAILRAMTFVHEVVAVDDTDGTVGKALRKAKPKYFGNGGDRTGKDTMPGPEQEACEDIGIKMEFGLGGGKSHSSSAIASNGTVERAWGRYVILDEGPGYKVKKLILDPHSATSHQKHEKRVEHWFYSDFPENFQRVDKGEWHRLKNPTDRSMTVIEVQTGICEESDIDRV